MTEMTEQPERLTGRRVAFLATDGVEEVEYVDPRAAVERAGALADLISITSGMIQSMQHNLDKSDQYPVDALVAEVDPNVYDALVIPGGVASPDRLRMSPDAVDFVRTFMQQNMPVAAICHGPWLLVEADAVRGRTVTSYPSLRTDLRNAGANWVDEPVQVDEGLVTSRRPADLPAFCSAMIEEIAIGQRMPAY